MRAILMLGLAACVLLCDGFAAEARQRMTFVPGGHTRTAAPRAYHRYAARHYWPQRRRSVAQAPRAVRRPSGGADDAGEAVARPGGGFTMQDGVLTYPAPARFQPQNLKKQ